MKKIDSDFFNNNNQSEFVSIEQMLGVDEKILWQQKPKRIAFVLSKIITMLPIAIIWLAFDAFFIYMLCSSGTKFPTLMIVFFVVFFLFHLTPVWIWLAKVITASRQYKNVEYAFTEKRIIIKSGIVGIDFKSIYYTDINSVNVKVGFVDKILKVGDIQINVYSNTEVLSKIGDPYNIAKKLEQIVYDLKNS